MRSLKNEFEKETVEGDSVKLEIKLKISRAIRGELSYTFDDLEDWQEKLMLYSHISRIIGAHLFERL